jgi:hypothetical protein
MLRVVLPVQPTILRSLVVGVFGLLLFFCAQRCIRDLLDVIDPLTYVPARLDYQSAAMFVSRFSPCGLTQALIPSGSFAWHS